MLCYQWSPREKGNYPPSPYLCAKNALNTQDTIEIIWLIRNWDNSILKKKKKQCQWIPILTWQMLKLSDKEFNPHGKFSKELESVNMPEIHYKSRNKVTELFLITEWD